MFPRITDVQHIEAYRLELTFSHGEKAERDFEDRIVGRGGIFVPLEDVEFFKQVTVDLEAGTLVWPMTSISARMSSIVKQPDARFPNLKKPHPKRPR